MTSRDPNILHHGSASRTHSQERLLEESDVMAPPIISRPNITRIESVNSQCQIKHKVYRRRYFGLIQLVLLNIVVSWEWIALAPVSNLAAEYFNTTESVINWLSTAFLFSFVVATPFTFWTLSKHGPKTSIIISAGLMLVGSWIKVAAFSANAFPAVMVGQLLIGFAQPFVLAAPTTYSDLWFSPGGRTTATAIASLANPFGAALGQLISPFWVHEAKDIPYSLLWVAIIASIACIPSFFIPNRPPTPPTAISEAIAEADRPSTKMIKSDLMTLARSVEFWLLFIPFSVYVGFFNAFSSLLNQILEPYGFSEDDAGIAGAVLIVVGLLFAAITSPLNDKYKFYLWFIRIAVPVLAIMYLVFIFAPATLSIPFVYVVCAVLGAASFGLVPVVLEFLVEVQHPTNPSVSSSLLWSGGQLLGGLFIVIMDALKAGSTATPAYNMHNALIFQAVIALVVMPLPLVLGLLGRGEMIKLKRWESERSTAEASQTEVYRDE